MLVVEGPDGAGKSTLVKWLAEQLEWPVHPRVVDKDTNSMISSLKRWVEETDTGQRQMIYDRHRLISEPIYGPIFRHTLAEGFDEMKWLSDAWRKFDGVKPIILFCLPPLDEVRANVVEGHDNQFVRDRIDIIYWQYWTLCARMIAGFGWGSITFHCDYTRLTWEEDRDWLLTYIQSCTKHWPKAPTGV